MTFENLRLIRDVVHHRSVSKAARLNDISQSAASQALQEAERELGVPLFDRSTRPLTITPAGKLYAEYCRDVLRRHEEVRASLDSLSKRASGVARLAAIYSVGLSEMSQIEARFAARFPDGELQVSYLRPERVWEAVELDQADLGLMSYAESSREVIALPWRDEEMVVAVAAQHPLALREAIVAQDLDCETFVGFDDDLPIQDQIERYLRDYKVNVDIALRFDNLQMIKEAVAHGAGISIMPERVMREDIEQGRLVGLRLQPAELFRPVRIVHRRRKVFSDVTAGLLAMLREEEQTNAA
ncbi:MAG: LysR family transcriptional regulator [Silvibacterium sp.]|nr:LysR family transcriptional regulator [Acidobacteriaceae bacterium]MBV8632321.1 LysR family transcriptional regulator [Silvibacterium sp.]